MGINKNSSAVGAPFVKVAPHPRPRPLKGRAHALYFLNTIATISIPTGLATMSNKKARRADIFVAKRYKCFLAP